MTTVTVSVDLHLGELSTAELMAELESRGQLDDSDPLVAIWQGVNYRGLALDEAVDELMRERGFPWQLRRQVAA